MKIYKNLFLFLLIVFIYSCDENIYEDQEGAWSGVIVPGKSIEGVKLGDTREEVVRKLGETDAGGIQDGQFRSWFGSDYIEGPHAGLSISYIEHGDGSRSPADIISAGTSYKGKTGEGIKIGSSLPDVHKAYGEPDRTWTILGRGANRSFTVDIYCINHKHFEIHYMDSLITGFSIGYFLPPPDEFNDCK